MLRLDDMIIFIIVGVIIKCTVTRNKERIYDIEFDDDRYVQTGVREEYIRIVHVAGNYTTIEVIAINTMYCNLLLGMVFGHDHHCRN